MAETVYRDRKRQLPLELPVELTEETFNATVTSSDSIVLFYAACEYEPLEEITLFRIKTIKEFVLQISFCILLLHIMK